MARTLLVVIAFIACVTTHAQTDPVVGKWLGTVKSTGDEVEIALEIKPKDGGLEVLLYQPILNLYGAPLTITRDGDKVVLPELGGELTLKGARMEGTMTSLHLPVWFARTDKLPSDAPVPDLPKGPEPLWATKLGGVIYATAAVRDGIAYVGTTGGVMNAVRIKDGSFVWTFSAGRPIHGAALATADALYFVCDNGYLFKLLRSDGKEVWRHDLGDSRVSRILGHPGVFDWDYSGPTPVLADNAVYVGSGDGSVHAVDAAKGSLLWRFATKDKVRSDIAVDGDRVYAGSNDAGVYALKRTNGELIWRRDLRAAVTSSPVVIDGKVVAGNRGGGLYALDPKSGEIVWRGLFWGSWVESSPVPYGDVFYVGSSDLRRVTCYDPKNGKVVWRTDVYGWNWGRPAVTEKLVYTGVAGGEPYPMRHTASLTALDRTTGKIVWRWVPPANNSLQWGFGGGPVIEGNVLVIAALDGTLYGFPVA